MTIDVHAHYVPEAVAEAFRARTAPPRIEAGPDGERLHMPIGSLAFGADFTDMEARIVFMDEHGVERQLLSFPGLFGLDSLPAAESAPLLCAFNEAVAGLVRRYPDRFLGLAALPLADMDAAVAELRRAVVDLGLAGAILPVNGFVSSAHAARFVPLLAAADELGAHLFVHPGRRPDEVPDPTAPAPAATDEDLPIARRALAVQAGVAQAMVTLLFSELLDPFERLTLHVANLGGTLPMVIERMDHVAATRTPGDAPFMPRARTLHVDCASLGSRAIEIAAAVFGADRLLTGTDCPIFGTAWTLKAIEDADLSQADKEAIRAGNANRLLRRFIDG